MVTHDPDEAMANCDKVAVMNDGIIKQNEKEIRENQNFKIKNTL